MYQYLQVDGREQAISPKPNLFQSVSDVLQRELRAPGFPNTRRGQKLFSVADFSGAHRGAKFDTYAFLILDLDRNNWWLSAQREFRQKLLRDGRRLSFKNLNDRVRRHALAQFLSGADEIEGVLIVFAVEKSVGSIFDSPEDGSQEPLLKAWKKSVHEHLLRITHLGALSVARVSRPDQDLLWISDQDKIASNDFQLTALTKLFATIWGNVTDHPLRHFRCGTTKCDDGSLALEDFAAIPDLAAGATCELISKISQQRIFPVMGITTALPSGLSSKTQKLSHWLANTSKALRHILIVIDGESRSSGTKVTLMKLQIGRAHV